MFNENYENGAILSFKDNDCFLICFCGSIFLQDDLVKLFPDKEQQIKDSYERLVQRDIVVRH